MAISRTRLRVANLKQEASRAGRHLLRARLRLGSMQTLLKWPCSADSDRQQRKLDGRVVAVLMLCSL